MVFNSNIASKSTSDLLFGAAVLLLQDLGCLSLGFEPLHHLHQVPHLRSKLRPNMERSHPCYISKYVLSHPCYVSKCVYTNPRGSPHLGERLLDLVHVKPLTDHLALESTFCSIFLDLCLNLLVDSFHREGLTGCGGRFASRTLAAEKKRVHLIQQKRKSYLVTKVPSIIFKADNS